MTAVRTATRLVSDAMVTIPKVHPADVTTAEIRSLFTDDHVHIALLVDGDGLLVTTIERSDLTAGTEGPAAVVGTLLGRVTDPDQTLEDASAAMTSSRRRRLAVVDASGRLVGLLCLKRTGDGFCTDDGVRSRQSGRHRAIGEMRKPPSRHPRA